MSADSSPSPLADHGGAVLRIIRGIAIAALVLVGLLAVLGVATWPPAA
jgi:hypothetical protein